MIAYLTYQQFVRVAAVVIVALTAVVAVIHSRSGREAAILAPLEPGEADALVHELARCRTVTPNDVLVLEACRRMWAANRQHFFVPSKSPQSPARPAPDAPAGFVKSQERVLPPEVDQSRTR
jgi:conjugative transfer region protein TrbK